MGKLNLTVATLGSYEVNRKSSQGKVATLVDKRKNDGSALGYLGAKVGIGAASIFEGIGDFVQGSVYQLMGDKEYAKYLHMNDVTGGWNERLDKNYNPSGVMKVAGDIGMGLGQAVPSLAVGVATGGLGAAAGAIGSAAIGAGYAGRGITDAVKQTGELGAKENIYGIATGALEGATDALLGGVQKAGKGLARGISGTLSATKLGAQKVARQTLVKGILSSAGSEALEEFIQEYADTALLRLTKVNREAEFSFQNALYSGLIGGITGGIMGGATGMVNNEVNFRRGDDIRKRGLEEQLIKTADYVRDEHLGNVSNFDNVTNENLKALAASVDAYRKLSDKSGRQGTIILGEIKRELLGFETSAGVDRVKTDMMTSSEAQRSELAATASRLFGKTVSAEDIAKNTGDVTHRLALESYVAGILSDSSMEQKRSQINEAVAAERLPYIAQSASWDGQSAVQYRDPKSGKYIFIEPAEDGTWRMAYSPTAVYDENNLMIKDGLSTEDVKKTLAGLADGSLVIGERGIYTPEALEREKVKQFKNTKKGRKAKKDYKRELKAEKKASRKNVTPTSDVRSKVAGRRYYSIASGDGYVEYDKPINQDDVKTLQAIGEGISINQFSSGNIRETQKWAYKFYKELGIKSPFFRRWFGDWRRFDKKTVKVITANKVEGKNPRGVFTNSDTGWNIVSSSVGYDETVSHSGKDKKSIKAMRVIDKIIENSILLDTQVSNYGRGKKSIYTSFMHKFYAIVKIDDMPYLAKMAVDESYDPGHTETYKKFYHVRAIEIEPMASVGIGFNHTPIMETTSSTISIADLYEIVKTYDKEFSTASQVNKVALNDDGTPKVFYHGTKVEIAEFNRGEKNGWLGKGIYFAEDKKYAKENGKHIVVAYLRINNPFIVKGESPSDILSEVKEKFPQADEYSLADVLKAEGYDSIVFKHWDKGMIISVFEPSQIKSANGNIGTFDSDEKKIKYSIDTTEGSQSGERVESEQEGVSEAQEAAESENASEKPSEMSERERKRGYSDKEANAARAIVKDFDTMSREKRLSIIEMMRSAESNGASKSFMKHAAAMIGYWRKGLWIIADKETSENGFYQPFSDGTRLIVVNPSKKSDNGKSAIDTAFVHELAHDIWDRATAKTKDALYRMATEGASAAEVDDIREEYKDGYAARGLDLDADTLREEVFTNLIGKTLGNEAFLERFDLTPGRMTSFKRSIKAVTRMAKGFFGKDKYLYSRCEKMARSLIRVMGVQTALEAVGGTDKRYMFAGNKAKTADKSKLENAKRLLANGVDSEAIRKETGWFKGYDGKWRFEIDDSEMTVSVPESKHVTVGDIVSHQKLFEAYPDLKDIWVTFHDLENARGSYSRVFGDIELSTKLLENPQELKSVISHELQHAIQDKEGFAKGASVEYWERKLVEGYDSRQAYIKAEEKDLLDQIKAMRHEDREFVWDMEELLKQKPNHPRGAINWDTLEKIEEDSPQWKHFDKERDALAKIYGDSKVSSFLTVSGRLEQIKHKAERDALQLYYETAGEIEARDVQKRLHLDVIERKNTRPDIDDADVVFAGDTAVSFFAKEQYDKEKAGIHDQIRNSQDALNKMDIVFSSQAPYKVGMAYDAGTWAIGELKKYGFQADRQNFGKVMFDEKTIRDAMNYLDTDAEKVSIIAIYKVIKRGIQIGEHGNHKERGKHTITFAAPVEINGIRGNMAVVVNMRNNQYKVHRILMPDGSIFKFDEYKKNTERETQRGVPKNRSLADATSSVSNNSIPQNPEKSTPKSKKSFSLSENSSTKGGEFDGKDFIEQAIENGGSFKKANDAAREYAKANKPKKKSKTKAQIQAELRETKKENRGLKKANENISKTAVRAQKRSSELFEKNIELEREARASEQKAKNAEKREAALGDKMEQEKAKEVKRIATSVKKLVNDFSFLVNEATHRKYTDGGTVGATILADPAIQAFAAYFAKRGSAYNIMNKSTRDGVKLLLEFYNPDNPIFADENNAAMFFGENSNNIFSSYRPEVAEMIKSIAEGEGDLSFFEMQQLGDIVRNVRHIYENYDAVRRKGKSESAKIMAARSYEAQAVADRTLTGNGEVKGIKKFFKIFKESYLYTVVTPEEVLRDLENHVKDPILSQLYREVRLGEAEAGRIRAEILTPITEFLAKKENKEFFDNLTKPSLDFHGIKISMAQAVGIYETSKRQHAQGRLYDPDSGIMIYDAESGKRVPLKKITRNSINELYGKFDATAKEYIKHLEAAMAACKKYKVDTDYDVMGFTNAIDGHYYPITTDPNYFAKDITDIRQSMGIEDVVKNKSFNKNTVQGAQAPLVIEDSQRVLERHVFGIAQYAGLYIPLQNFGKVYGAKFDPSIPAEEQNRDSDLDKLRQATKVTQKTTLREHYNTKVWVRKDGSGGLDSYLTKLFADIQRIKPGESSLIDRAVEFIRSGYVNSIFGLNAKIIFTQLASYPAAFRLIDTDCLARAFGNDPFSKGNTEAMDKYSRITLARQFEGSNAAEGLVEKLSELGKKTSIGIEITDRGTIMALYSACQLQVEKDGGTEVGSEANLKAAAELLDNVLLDTQTTSLMSDRSALARDKNEFAKVFSMFRNEAVKAFSNFYGSIGAYIDHKKLSEVDESYGKLLDEDKKKIARNMGAYLGSSAVVAAVSIAFSRLRSIGKDDEEKEKIGAMVAKESVGMVFDLFPIISDAASFMIDGYEMDSIPLEVLNDMLTAFRGTKVLFDIEATSEEKAKYLRNTAYTAGKVVGLPVQNAARIANTTVAIFNKPLAYKFSDSFDTTKTYKSDLERAINSGNLRLAETITSLWVSDKMTGKASEEAVDELVRLYSVVDEDGNRIFKYPKVVPSSLSAKEKARFMEVYSEADDAMGKLLLSKEYKALDDKGKADAVKNLYNEYYKKAQEEIDK